MQISITEKEVNAIDFGLEQIRDALEGSSSEGYKQGAEEAMRSLGNILRKCHLAREKANDLNKPKDIFGQETDGCLLQNLTKWQGYY